MRARAALLILPAVMAALILTPVVGAETVTLPSGAATGTGQSDPIYQVACPAAGDCVAVGAYKDASGHNQALIETEHGGNWSAANVPDASLPNAGSTPLPYLTGVACTVVGSCVAVDAYDDSSGNEQGLIDVQAVGVWTPIEAPLGGLSVAASPFSGVEVADVVCPAFDACVGIGSYVSTDTYEYGLIETQSATGWSATAMPMPANQSITGSDPNFYTVSCAGAGSCAAVGYYTDSAGNQQGLLETDSGGVWQPATELDLSQLQPATDPDAQVTDVSCTAIGSCTAVGNYQTASGSNQAFAVQEVAGQWQPAAELMLPANASTVAAGANEPAQGDLLLNGVSCSSTGNCTAVGSYDATAADAVEPLTFTETGGTWAAGAELTLPNDGSEPPAANPEAALDSVTCSASEACLAAGTYVAGTAANAALIARENGSGWTSAAADLGSQYDPTPPLLYWADVACAPGDYCAVGGYVSDNASGNEDGFLLDSPGAPSGVTVTLSGTQAIVSWPAPKDNGGLPIGGYTVTANDLSNPASGGQAVSVPGSATTATVGDLVSGDSYSFTVTPSSLLGSGVGATSATVSASSPHAGGGPSRAQIRASLKALLRPRGRAAELRTLRRGHRYRFHYHRAVEAGRITVRWYEVVRTRSHKHGTRRHRTRRVLIASGNARVRGAGRKVTIVVRLSRSGRHLLDAQPFRHLHLIAVAEFKAGSVTVSRSGSFTLR